MRFLFIYRLLLLFAAIIFTASNAFSDASVKQVKGERAILDMGSLKPDVGDIYIAVDDDGKKKGILKIIKVNKKQALAEIVKGIVKEDWSVEKYEKKGEKKKSKKKEESEDLEIGDEGEEKPKETDEEEAEESEKKSKKKKKAKKDEEEEEPEEKSSDEEEEESDKKAKKKKKAKKDEEAEEEEEPEEKSSDEEEEEKPSDDDEEESSDEEEEDDSSSKKSRKSSSRLKAGVLVGYSMNKMTVQIPVGTNDTEPASLSGTGIGFYALAMYELSPTLDILASVGLENFDTAGNVNRNACSGSNECENKSPYIAASALGRYKFAGKNYTPWVGGGVGFMKPGTVTSNVLDPASIKATLVYSASGGVDWRFSSTMTVPIFVRYTLFPPAENVKANYISVQAGVAYSF